MLVKQRPIATTTTTKLTSTSTKAPATTAPTTNSTTTKQEAPPKAQAATSVGGKAIVAPGVLHSVRVAGRDVDVLLPTGTSFSTYVAALQKTGAFAAQTEQLATLATLATLASTTTTAPLHNDTRPTVGIVLSEPKMLVPGHHANTENLIALVEAMGCRPVLIPPCADIAVGNPLQRARVTASMAGALDGLVGPGGADVDPSIYGEANTTSINTNPLRDRFEADFVRTALDCDLFAFGICRSHQLWNAAAGGALIQDVQAEDVVSVSHKTGHHPVEFERKSMIYEEVRQRSFRVNSLHHQAVDWAGWGFRVVGRVKDEHTGKSMIEATERWNGITTQFHPELMQDDSAHKALFATLGRRAHIFHAMKNMGAPTLRDLVAHVKSDERYTKTDVDWVQRELARRLPP